MTIDEIKQILEMMRAHDVAEFELELEGTKLRVRKDHQPPPPAAPVAPLIATVLPAAGVAPASVVPAAAPAAADDDDDAGLELAVVTSPIVGTFYRSPSPEAAVFVDVGQVVRKGQTLCIIEAMKLMNEIESEYEGEVAKVYVESGQPVQYGERLFAIKVG